MKKIEILHSENIEWGFCGTYFRNGGDAARAWRLASEFLIEEFELTPAQARFVLDSTTGRHLADQLSIETGLIKKTMKALTRGFWARTFKIACARAREEVRS